MTLVENKRSNPGYRALMTLQLMEEVALIV